MPLLFAFVRKAAAFLSYCKSGAMANCAHNNEEGSVCASIRQVGRALVLASSNCDGYNHAKCGQPLLKDLGARHNHQWQAVLSMA
jgi:hypothetical protein